MNVFPFTFFRTTRELSFRRIRIVLKKTFGYMGNTMKRYNFFSNHLDVDKSIAHEIVFCRSHWFQHYRKSQCLIPLGPLIFHSAQSKEHNTAT